MHINKFSIGWVEGGTHQSHSKCGYQDNFKSVYFFKEKVWVKNKHKSSKNNQQNKNKRTKNNKSNIFCAQKLYKKGENCLICIYFSPKFFLKKITKLEIALIASFIMLLALL